MHQHRPEAGNQPLSVPPFGVEAPAQSVSPIRAWSMAQSHNALIGRRMWEFEWKNWYDRARGTERWEGWQTGPCAALGRRSTKRRRGGGGCSRPWSVLGAREKLVQKAEKLLILPLSAGKKGCLLVLLGKGRQMLGNTPRLSKGWKKQLEEN